MIERKLAQDNITLTLKKYVFRILRKKMSSKKNFGI